MAAKKTAKKRASKKAVRKKAPAKKKAVRKKAPARRSKDETREWGTTKEVLQWLEEDGLELSEKNLYAHYGPSSKAPCPKRPKDKKWNYAVLVQQVKLNRDKNPDIDYSSVNKLGLAIKQAELKKKAADADKAEMTARKMAGELIEKASVFMVLRRAAVDLETNRKKLIADLQRELKLKPAQVKLVDAATKNWMAALSETFRGMDV